MSIISECKMLIDKGFARVDTLEIRALIIRKIGRQRAEKYFDQLSRLFSLKISKNEFDKSCMRTIGRENVRIHNQLIRSIIKNACNAKVPPHKTARKVGIGGAAPKGRSCVPRDRKFQDRPSPLGKPRSELEHESPTELISLGSRPPVEVASVEDGEEVEQAAVSPGVQSRSPVTAPLGIGGSRKTLYNNSTCNSRHLERCQNSKELPDTRTLRTRLEQKLEMEGISVSLDCVNLLNNSLDTYLKRLLQPCVGLAASTRGYMHLNQPNQNLRYLQRSKESFYASMLDFRVAMEQNPQLLGEDWPTQLEKICLRASEG